jgi:hypothetical protein
MLYVHLVGLVKANKLTKMHGVNNFKIGNYYLCNCNAFVELLSGIGIHSFHRPCVRKF